MHLFGDALKLGHKALRLVLPCVLPAAQPANSAHNRAQQAGCSSKAVRMFHTQLASSSHLESRLQGLHLQSATATSTCSQTTGCTASPSPQPQTLLQRRRRVRRQWATTTSTPAPACRWPPPARCPAPPATPPATGLRRERSLSGAYLQLPWGHPLAQQCPHGDAERCRLTGEQPVSRKVHSEP